MISFFPGKNDTKSSEKQVIGSRAPILPLNTTEISPPSFEQISISTLNNFELFTSANNFVHSTNIEADAITGRLGEQLVFQYLKHTYPNEDIKWMNEEEESYRPFDIHRIITSENGREEFIEVKTTRAIDQHTFPISIGEVKCLLNHPSNYFIYRVYYADPINLSIITVIEKIADCLKLQHIKLNMLIPLQSSA